MSMISNRLTSIIDVERFLLAGNARFTLVSKKTGTRFTYRVKASDDGKVWFVSLMNGPDNESSYAFFGTIFDSKAFRVSAKSRIGRDAPSVKAFEWFYDRTIRGLNPLEHAEFWHEGACGRCARPLTVPASIVTGFGPDCAEQLGIPYNCAQVAAA